MTIVRVDFAIADADEKGRRRVDVSSRGVSIASFPMASADGFPTLDTGSISAETLTATIEGLQTGSAAISDVHALGDFLYAVLVEPAWSAIEPALAGAGLVELAIAIPITASTLAGLPWEMMRRSGQFLAAGLTVGGGLVDVAITRRVRRGPAQSPRLVQPLRYMFAVGAELNGEVRVGAETLGLLRQIGPAVRESIVQRQSPERLAQELAKFDPHIVHLICHGREAGDGGVELEMWNDDTKRAEYLNADALVDRIVRERGAERLSPAIVILSACSSGQRLACAGATDLATALVARGVPMVIGMSAEIRDLACRLFTRRLGTAIVDRTPLIAAAVSGRRAALRSNALPQDSFDWGMIQVILGDDIDGTLSVEENPVEDQVVNWLRLAGLPIDLDPNQRRIPPLCGGMEFLAAFAQLMSSETYASLLLYAQPPERRRLGKRRAFAEIAAASIRGGHVPVIVMPTRASGYPTEPNKLVAQLCDAFIRARARMELDDDGNYKLSSLPEKPSGTAFLAALQADALKLQADAQAAHDFVRAAKGRVIVMMHDVHRYAAAAPLALELLGASGAGLGKRVPVVMSWANDQFDPMRQPAHEDDLKDRLRAGATWILKIELQPLGDAESSTEARLAYQRVLLHPFRTKPDYAAKAYFLDLKKDTDALKEVLSWLSSGTGDGYLGEFAQEEFLLWLKQAVRRQSDAFRVADDDDILRGGG